MIITNTSIPSLFSDSINNFDHGLWMVVNTDLQKMWVAVMV
jgi:hypothetical protein